MRNLMKMIILGISVSILPASSFSQQLSIMGGPIYNDKDKGSGSVMLEYSQKIQGPFSFSAAYLNEGHFSGHHRDGVTVQGWLRTDIFRRLSVGVGVGPYLYSDTKSCCTNSHGLGAIASLDAQWTLSDRWYLDIRSSYVIASKMNTFPILVGLGYKFDSLRFEKTDTSDKNELTAFLGLSVVSNSDEKNGFAQSVEYRRQLLNHMDVTVSYLNEGKNERVERQGVAIQLWATQKVSERIGIGIGAGLYEAYDKYRESNWNTNGIVSITGSYRVYNDWYARVSWSRIVSTYDKDSDLILVGIGYKFNWIFS